MSGILGRSHRERFAKSLQRISWPSNEIQMRKSCIGENSRAADVPGIRRCNILGIYASLTPVWRGSPIGQEIKACLAFTHIYPTCFTSAFGLALEFCSLVRLGGQQHGGQQPAFWPCGKLAIPVYPAMTTTLSSRVLKRTLRPLQNLGTSPATG